jgi:hypothetical protein
MLRRHQITVIVFSQLLLALFASSHSYAIPAFSRQYGTSCSTCHVDFPKLNDFGKAFKDAGFKFPKDDETFIKIPPVMLGSPAQKELWPHTIMARIHSRIATDRAALQYVLAGRGQEPEQLQSANSG